MERHLISIRTICIQYDIDDAFMESLHTMGLLEMEVVDQTPHVHRDHMGDLEKILRLHKELNVNLEGIDVILNLLQKERSLRQEIQTLRSRLSIYESE